MTDLLPPYHKPMTSQLDCDLANDRVAALEAELERVRELNGELAHANVLYIGSAKRLTEDRDHHRRVGECFADKLRQAEAELTKWKEMANAQATDALDLIEARAMSGFCGYCGITPGHSVGCPVARAEALQSMLTGDAIAIVERAEQAEAALAAERERRCATCAFWKKGEVCGTPPPGYEVYHYCNNKQSYAYMRVVPEDWGCHSHPDHNPEGEHHD